MCDPLSEWVWEFDRFSVVQMCQTLTMPLGSLLFSHNRFGLWGATKTISALSHAIKQPVADGAWRHVELMLCRICSIQLMIMTEMILWYSYSPSQSHVPMDAVYGILVFFFNILQNEGTEYVQVTVPLIFCSFLSRKSFAKHGHILQELWWGKAQSWKKFWLHPSLQLPSILLPSPVNLITFSRKTGVEKMLMKTSSLYKELQQQRVFNKRS